MTRFGLDSTSEVGPAAHHAIGSTVALRYLSRYTAKVVTAAELANYRAHKIDLCLVFEDSADNALRGYEQGKADAEFAQSQAGNVLGQAARPPHITFAVDIDPTGRSAQTDPYFDGVAAVLGRDRSGPYGGFEVIAHQAGRGFKYLWQTYAWSGGRFFQGAQLYQYSNDHTVGGVGVDFDHIFPNAYGDFGQWDYVAPPSPDPHHYDWFAANEKPVVMEYDRLRATQTRLRHPHRQRLAALRVTLAYRANDVYRAAHRDPVQVPASFGVEGLPSWGKRHRGFRFQGLIRRSQGERLV